MATINLGTTKNMGKLYNYAEKRATVTSAHNTDPAYAKAQMRATRKMWSKTGGIQAHHVIQSFRPDEISPEKANELGLKLAERIGEDHEVVVFTHTDKRHIHNHIVINSVNIETGYKYQAHGIDAINEIRAINDDICIENGLEPLKRSEKQQARYTRSEMELLEKGEFSWKNRIRQIVEHARSTASNEEEFKEICLDYEIKVADRGKDYTYHYFSPSDDKTYRARGKRLGAYFEKEEILLDIDPLKADLHWYEAENKHDFTDRPRDWAYFDAQKNLWGYNRPLSDDEMFFARMNPVKLVPEPNKNINKNRHNDWERF